MIQLKKPSPIGLSKRLKEICEAEHLKVDLKSLIDLCELMEGDLRACLHTLQVLAGVGVALLNDRCSVPIAPVSPGHPS